MADIPTIIAELDALSAAGRAAEVQALLETRLHEARAAGDWSAELTVLSELLGQYRLNGKEREGLDTADAAVKLVRERGLEESVTGATVYINAATTLKRFGAAPRSVELFDAALRVYMQKLGPSDYRFAGLYNNMALTLAELGDGARAERYYKLAMDVMERLPHGENELAATLCNLAELYESADTLDKRIGECMERAWEYLNAPTLPRDGYHAFTAQKCAPCFDHFGYFLYAKELKVRAEKSL